MSGDDPRNGPLSGVKESPSKEIDDAINELDVLAQAVHEFGFPVYGYLENEVRLGLVMSFEEGRAHEFFAVFHRVLCGDAVNLNRADAGCDPPQICPNGDDRAVLVLNVEGFQSAKHIAGTVRLQAPHEFFDIGTDAVEEVDCFWPFPKVTLAPVYREVSFLQDTFIVETGPLHEGAREGVHRTHKIVEEVADYDTPQHRNLLDYLKSVDVKGWLRIAVNDNFVWVSIREGFELRLKVVKVLLGPLDLYSTTKKRIFRHGGPDKRPRISACSRKLAESSA